MINKKQIACSLLAPYTDWDDLVEWAKVGLKNYILVEGSANIAKISTRFLNRIDIPHRSNANLFLDEYFDIGVKLPEITSGMEIQSFDMSCRLVSSPPDFARRVRLATVASPLIDHLSFLLDIDVVSATPIPSRHDDIWPMLGEFRKAKNLLFEACIKDPARELFR